MRSHLIITRNPVPKISIITVCLNSENTILRTIESVRNQNYKNIEHVIVDGGSTDGTIGVIKKAMIPGTVFNSEPDTGISDAFNKGVIRATGEWLMFINSDDELIENSIERIVPKLPTRGILCPAAIWRESAKDWSVMRFPNSAKIPMGMAVNHPGTLVHSSVFQDFGHFDTRYRTAMDYEFLLRMYQQKVKFRDCRLPVAIFNRGGVSDQNWKSGLREIRRAKIENGISPFTSSLYYAWQFTRRTLYGLALDMGLNRSAHMARKVLSQMEEKSAPGEGK